MNERDRNRLNDLQWKKAVYERSDEYRIKLSQKAKTSDFLQGVEEQREWQESLANELRYVGGTEFAVMLKEVMEDWVLRGKFKCYGKVRKKHIWMLMLRLIAG